MQMPQPRQYFFAPALLLLAIGLGVLPLLWFSVAQGGRPNFDAHIWRILGFTLLQASLSTLISIVLAIPVARALVRQQLSGLGLLRMVFAVPLSLPVIVAVLGITTIYGNSGLLGGVLPIYGLSGIMLAHVFFNLPLAARLLADALENVPPESHRLAAQLNFNDWQVWRHVDWPVLRPLLPRLAALVFLLCAASFVIVLTLGGPSATTLEVAIYHALRLDFDVSRALTLSMVQVALSALLVWGAGRLAYASPLLPTFRQTGERLDGKRGATRLLDFTALGIAACIVLPPLVAVVVAGIMQVQITWALLQALATSMTLGCASSLLVLSLAWPLAQLQNRGGKAGLLSQFCGIAGLIVPPAVMATGWFLAVRTLNGGPWLAAFLVICLNALMALPFVMTTLAPAVMRSHAMHDKLCLSFGIGGWDRFRTIDFPVLRPVIGQALLMGFVLSLGDLTAITLLGNGGLVTLPSLVAQQMGNYRSAAAGGTALLLAALCFSLTFLAHRLGERR